MPRYAQLVVGPAGSGKSTYCKLIQDHLNLTRRQSRVVNLDPAAEHFAYEAQVDIRELISIEDVMEDEELRLGPNGGLVFCMEHLAENLEWLHEAMDPHDDDYFLIDCPGQIELYTHLSAMRTIVDKLKSWDFYIGAVFLMDSQFLVEKGKYLSGIMAALSTMVTLEIPHVNVMTKVDVLTEEAKEALEEYMDPAHYCQLEEKSPFGNKYTQLANSLMKVIEDYSLVSFFPLDRTDEDSIQHVVSIVDQMIQYGEDQDVKARDDPEMTEEQEDFFDKQMKELGIND